MLNSKYNIISILGPQIYYSIDNHLMYHILLENDNPLDNFQDELVRNLIAPIFDNGYITNDINNTISVNFNSLRLNFSYSID